MWRINLRYARWFNRRYRLRGHVFGGRYHARLVADAPHGLEVSRYIPLNPVAAGLCSRPEEWPWSSYAATIGLVPVPSFLRPGVMLEQFGDEPLARRRYRQFVEDGLTRLSQVPGTGETAGTRYRRIRG
jgi:hypothetical protein